MNDNKRRTVLIVDDQNLFVEGLSHLLKRFDNLDIIGTVDNGNDVISFVKKNSPDVILLDLNLPGKNGVEILEEIRAFDNEVIISILSMYADYSLSKKCKKIGANAYLTKDADLDELRKVIFEIGPNDFYHSKLIFEQNRVQSIKQDKFNKFALITSREKEIIRMLVKGLTSPEISKKLFISLATVQTHRKNIFNKLKVKKVSELIRLAYENNLS